jgi:hypothetical protein
VLHRVLPSMATEAVASGGGSSTTDAIHCRKTASKTSGFKASNKLRKLLAQGGLR